MNIFGFVPARWWVAPVLAVFAAALARAAATPELPPLNDPPTNARLPGKFVWVDLTTPDVARAEAVYGKLFGWTFRKIGDGDDAYALAFFRSGTDGRYGASSAEIRRAQARVGMRLEAPLRKKVPSKF